MQAIILGIVQGATEFMPVSSSAHLVLMPWLLGWASPGLAFDTVLHLGTLLAVLAVFWRDFVRLAAAWRHSISTRLNKLLAVRPSLTSGHREREPALAERTEAQTPDPQAQLAWWVILGTIPAGLMGILWEDWFEALFHSPLHVSVFLLVTSLWLALTERLGRKVLQAEDMGGWQALLVGLAQGFAIAPGISRSGATIGAGLLVGLKRDAAARFSFLLSAPIVLAAGLLQVKRLLESPGLEVQILPLTLGFLGASLSGYACIRLLLRFVREHSMSVFSAYCCLAGLFCIAIYLLR